MEGTPQQTGFGRSRRLAEVAAFAAVWMAIGELTGAGLNAYLLTGVPLTAVSKALIWRDFCRLQWGRAGDRVGFE